MLNQSGPKPSRPARWLCCLLLIASLPAVAQHNPCADKHWLTTPIVNISRSDGEGGGIGGTGFTPQTILPPLAKRPGDGEDGIGGTGIIGVIAGFASICVNGVEVHYDATTPVHIDGLAASAEKLALGQSVSVRSIRRDGSDYASEIRVFHEVAGPVEAINLAENQLVILGQTVRLPADLMGEIAVGSSLAVSGHRLPDGSISALRVDQRPPSAGNEVSVLGPVSQVTGKELRIGQLLVRVSVQPTQSAALITGDEAMIRGRLLDGVLHAESIQRQPRLSFLLPVERIHLQGYVRQGDAGHLNLEGTTIALDEKGRARSALPGQRIEVQMRVGVDGGMVVEHWANERPALETAPPPRYDSRPGVENAQGGVATGIDERLRTPEFSPASAAPQIYQPALLLPTGRPELQRPEMQRPELPRPEIQNPGLMRPATRPELPRMDPPRTNR